MNRLRRIITDLLFVGCFISFLAYKKKKQIETGVIIDERDKYEKYYIAVSRWKTNEISRPVYKFLKEAGYRNIAVYGAKELGKLVYEELKDSDISVNYMIDKDAEKYEINGINIYYPEEILPRVDAIVVTPFHYYKSIKRNLQTVVSYPIISLSDILAES